MKSFILFISALIFFSCSSSNNYKNSLDQDFLSDLASENNRIAGDLYLDYFNEDLSDLSYDYYLTFITKNETPSAAGLSRQIKNADYHYFKSMKEFFIVALYYEDSNMIVCDNSNTAFIDSLQVYQKNDTIPDLQTFVYSYLGNH